MRSLKRESEIIPLYLSGNSAPKIQDILGVSASHVYDILRRNKIKADPYNSGIVTKLTDSDKIEIIRLYKSGNTAPEIGNIYGVGSHWVRRFLKRNGVELRRQGTRSGELSNQWRGGLTKNKEYQKARMREYQKKKLTNDPLFKLEMALRNRVNSALKANGYKKQTKVFFLLGADFETIKSHIESIFQPGMDWENHGNGDDKWHIDHIVPCATAKDEESLLRLFHFSNLQPMWSSENLRKGSLYNGKRQRRKGGQLCL